MRRTARPGSPTCPVTAPGCATAFAPRANGRPIAAAGSIRPSCWSIPTPSNSTGASSSTPTWRAMAPTPPHLVPRAIVPAALPEVAARTAALPPRRADLRNQRPRLHHAPSGRAARAARHGRRARPSRRHRPFAQARGLGDRTDAGRRLDRRAPPAAARPAQCLGLQPGRADGARSRAGARRRRRTARDRGGAAWRGHRRDPRHGVQPHRRKRRPGRRAVAARARRRLPMRAGPTARWSTMPAAATCSISRRPRCRDMALAAMRHFVRHCGVDGFRFDLAPILARGPGFAADAPIFAEIAADPLLADRVLIAEPWDIGPGGYQLGGFPPGWLEWNDRFRDDVRRFWRGDGGAGVLATRLAGSSDIFGAGLPQRQFPRLARWLHPRRHRRLRPAPQPRERRAEPRRPRRELLVEQRRRGAERRPRRGRRRARPTCAPCWPRCSPRPARSCCAAGDEFGRSQAGNNNAYAQDNPLTWLDWAHRDRQLEADVATMAQARARRAGCSARFPQAGEWFDLAWRGDARGDVGGPGNVRLPVPLDRPFVPRHFAR